MTDHHAAFFPSGIVEETRYNENKIKTGGKLLLIGLLTTIVRIIGQLFLPAGTQDVLKPSIYVKNGTMPIVFTIYGIMAYTMIAFMFLLVKDKISGSRIIRGLKYSISCCLVWVVYLFEPLPHVAFLDKFTYPIADNIALFVMGSLAGILLCEKGEKHFEKASKINIPSIIMITVFFAIGRMIRYKDLACLTAILRMKGILMLTIEGLIAVISLFLTCFGLGYTIGSHKTQK